MSIVESTIVGVLNYSDSYCSFPTQIKPDGYLFEPSLDEDQPFTIPISFAEIRVANSQSNIFREGNLRFDPEVAKDVYEKLGIKDWEEILSDKQIRDIILNPKKTSLEKIVKITSSSLLERVRGILIMLENSGEYDISLRVKDVITRRHIELYNNQRKSDIVITATTSDKNQSVDIEKIKEELTMKIRSELEAEFKKETDRENEIAKIKESIRAELMAELEITQKDETSEVAKPKGRPRNQN